MIPLQFSSRVGAKKTILEWVRSLRTMAGLAVEGWNLDADARKRLGVTLDMSDRLAIFQSLKEYAASLNASLSAHPKGLEVESVEDLGAAVHANIVPGDVVTGCLVDTEGPGSQRILTEQALLSTLQNALPGDEIQFVVQSACTGKDETVTVELFSEDTASCHQSEVRALRKRVRLPVAPSQIYTAEEALEELDSLTVILLL